MALSQAERARRYRQKHAEALRKLRKEARERKKRAGLAQATAARSTTKQDQQSTDTQDAPKKKFCYHDLLEAARAGLAVADMDLALQGDSEAEKRLLQWWRRLAKTHRLGYPMVSVFVSMCILEGLFDDWRAWSAKRAKELAELGVRFD